MRGRTARTGMTLVELSLGVAVLTLGVLAVVGAYLSQLVLNEHGRNLSQAVHDANRVLEEIRQQNGGGVCTTPSAATTGGWDAWLQAQSPGKTLRLPATNIEERLIITCLDEDGGALATDRCGPNQVSASEWQSGASNTALDPILVTVAVCWRHRTRVVGECNWNGGGLVASDLDADGVIESPAMLTTLVTCRE